MRMDHYIKTQNNNIHIANILYALAVITVFILILGVLL
jgi:hypothetical protein